MAPAGSVPRVKMEGSGPADHAALGDVLERSARADGALIWEGASRADGWAAATRVLRTPAAVLGAALIRHTPESPAASARLALAPEARDRAGVAATLLIEDTLAQAERMGATSVRLFIPAGATWAATAAAAQRFTKVRSIYRMVRPADAEEPSAVNLAGGLQIRPMMEGEDGAILDALNRAWRGTWNYHPITADALARDLAGQREGMFLAVSPGDDGRIVGTTHAIFDPRARNPDGGPRAWISNVTTLPDWRGRGVARALLSVGLRYLVARGAGSIGLGVDAGNEVPLQLYRSVGFEVTDTLAVWEKATDGVPRAT